MTRQGNGAASSLVIMSRICTLGGGERGRLGLELLDDLGGDRCVVGLSVDGYGADPRKDYDAWRGWRSLEIARACVSTSGLFGFVDALGAWAELPLARLRTATLTHEVELARGFPERVGLAVGPLPARMRYPLGDRVLLRVHTRLGGVPSTLAFVIDVSGAAVFVDQVHDATGARSPFARR